jgi:hypothetical protein
VQYELDQRRAALITREEAEADARHLKKDVTERFDIAHQRIVARFGFDQHLSKVLAEEFQDALSELDKLPGVAA